MITWWIIALGTSFLNAVWFDLNKKFQINGICGWAWISFFSALLFSPSLFLVDIPTDPLFFVSLIVVGALISYGGVLLFDLSARYGGPVASLGRPLQILFSFIIWCLMDWQHTVELFSRIEALLGIMLAFVLAGWGKFRLVKNNLNIKAAASALIMVGLISGLQGPVTKLGMMFTWELEQALVWACLSHVAVFVITVSRYYCRPMLTGLFDKRVIKIGLGIGILQGCIGFLMPIAFFLSPNPAFVSLIAMLSTVWLMLYYAARKQDAHVRLWTVVLLLGAAVVLVVSTRGLG